LQGLEAFSRFQRAPAAKRRQLHGGILEADFRLNKLFSNPVIGAHTIRMQRWPRDLDLGKGLLSGNWKDIATIVSCRDASVFDDKGAGIPTEEFLRTLEDRANGIEAAAVRWAASGCCGFKREALLQKVNSV
jgi:hypothetical protein